jgi:hypothetical protein
MSEQSRSAHIATGRLRVLNRRLRVTEDKIIATKIKRSKASLKLMTDLWEHVLKKDGDLTGFTPVRS